MSRPTPDPQTPEPFVLADSASHLLHRAEQLASDRFAQLFGDTLTLRQFSVLAAVAAKPGLKQAELARHTKIDRSTLADHIARMEKRGWIDRTTSPLDARAQSVHLSGPGVAILAAATQHARAADAAILDALPRTKRKTFLNILAKLAKIADAAREKSERGKKKAKHDARRRAKDKDKKKKKHPHRQRAKA